MKMIYCPKSHIHNEITYIKILLDELESLDKNYYLGNTFNELTNFGAKLKYKIIENEKCQD